ncbi:MAG: hypothetical protein ACK4YO_03390, partial [Candidatus Altarchaeaceae archaeon]
RRKTGKHKCGICGGILNMPYDRRKIMKMSKSEKIPSRPFPMLCSRCARKVNEYVAMAEVKFKFNVDINFERNLVYEKFLPRGWFEKISSLGSKSESVDAKV